MRTTPLTRLAHRDCDGFRWKALNSFHPRLAGPRLPETIELSYKGGQPVAQLRKSWSGVSANIAEMRCDGKLHVDLGANAPRLSIVLEEVGGRFEIETRDWRSQNAAHESPQPLSLIAAGLDAHGRADGMRFMRHLVLQFDAATLAKMTDEALDLSSIFATRLMFADPIIMRLAQLFAEECTRDEPHSRLYGDNLSVALLLALSRLNAPRPASIGNGRLAPWQLRRVTEYLVAHVAEDVELQTMSDLVKMSRSYFSRAFKMSTGLAPHQWLMQARIAKAKELLLTSDHPLAQIAIDVGFADQAHFTRTFGRAVGESPGAWQRARCA
jgi:AraC family transcriptional regulator